jgi:hypothetical protein
VLKITINETPTEQRWILQGRLVGPWVDELRTSWKKAHSDDRGGTCVVDLSDVTFIDKAGERLLRAISKKGAHLVASGVYTKYVLEKVKSTHKHGLVLLIVCLFANAQTDVIVQLPRGRVPSARMVAEMRVQEDSGLPFNLATPWSGPAESSFNASRTTSSTVQVELMDAIDGANLTGSSADRAARTEEQ